MRLVSSLAAVASLVAVALLAEAGDGSGGKHKGGCRARCPSCDCLCTLSVSVEQATKHCYEVECKTICIPRVVFPWQKKDCGKGKNFGDGSGNNCGSGKVCSKCRGKGCSVCCSRANNGAKVKCVRELTKFEYECPECKYKWTPSANICGCCGGGSAMPDGRPADAERSLPPAPMAKVPAPKRS